MILSALKNYYKNWRFIFVSMGIVYLALILIVFGMVSGVSGLLSKGIQGSYEVLKDYIVQTVQNNTLSDVFQPEFIPTFINTIYEILRVGGTNVVAGVIGLGAVSAAFFVAACTAAQKVTRSLLRKESRGQNSKRGLVVVVFRYIVNAIFVSLLTYLAFMWVYSVIFTIFVFLIVSALENLFCNWYVHFRSTKLGVILNGKNAIRLSSTFIATFAVNVLSILLIASLFNVVLGVLVALPLVIYNSANNDVVSAEYFLSREARGKLTEDQQRFIEKRQIKKELRQERLEKLKKARLEKTEKRKKEKLANQKSAKNKNTNKGKSKK